jgi:hypothetical protein
MRYLLRWRLPVVCVAALTLSLGLAAASLLAQGEKQEAKDPKPRAEPRGRLPDFYNRVVTEQQREQIYGIQKKYKADIDKLEQQLAEVKARRDAEIEAVLSKEQLEQVKKLREAAAQRAKPAAGDAPAKEAPPAKEPPPAK